MRRITLLALLLVATAAPSHAQQLSSTCKREAGDEERPLRGRAAREDSVRRTVRAEIREQLLASAHAAGVDAPAGLVLLLTDAGRGEVAGRAFGGTLSDSLVTQVGRRALPRLAGWPGRGRVAIHMRLDSASLADRTTESDRLSCAPRMANQMEIQRRLQAFVSAHPGVVPFVTDRRGAELGMLLGRDGVVHHIELMRTSGSAFMDRFALELAREMRLLPGSVDGIPKDAWVVQPISVMVRPRVRYPDARPRP